ncbi:MAG: beta-lactamase family protein [Acidobacteriia bacterium]|nr:beta-lactamase family protein [Terriglobia bacterium]
MKPALFLVNLVLLAGCSTVPRQADPAALATTLERMLQTAVDQKRVPGVVAMVATGDGVVYDGAASMNKDAIFAIASMTKPVTSVAVMQLVEAGKVKVDEPASTYVSELAQVEVLENGKLRAPQNPITVRHLLTHTAGFTYEFMSPEIFELVKSGKVASMMAGGDAFLRAPLLFEPGLRWEYGINIDWLGRLVEQVSGEKLDAYFRAHIFEPLGMHDSYFHVPAEKKARMVKLHQRKEDGRLVEQPAPAALGGTFLSGGGGLYSTAADYLQFARAILNGGELGGKRILKPETVALMGQNQIGALGLHPLRSMIPQFAKDNAVLPGALDKFGFGFALNSKAIEKGRGANTLAWAGIFNTYFWIDREKKVCAVLLSQMSPGLDDGPAKLLEELDQAVYAWLR